MRTLAIINQKGGCGKTTTAINLSAVLARQGRRVLLVDMDPQGHCAAGLGVPEHRIDQDIGDAMLGVGGRGVEPGRLLWRPVRNLDLAPSRMRLAALEAARGALAEAPDRELRLRGVLEGLASGYDVAVIDCPPSIGLLAYNALAAADMVIVPVETGYFSLQGATRQLHTVRSIGRRVGRSVPVCVLPTLHDADNAVSADLLGELERRFRNLLVPVVVRRDPRLREAASFGQPVLDYAPGSAGAEDYTRLGAWISEALQKKTDWDPGPSLDEVVPEEAIENPAEARPVPAIAVCEEPASVPEVKPVTRAEDVARRAQQFLRRVALERLPAMTAPGASPLRLVPEAASVPVSPAATRVLGARQTHQGVLFVQPLTCGASVHVAGDFNNWSGTSHGLRRNPSQGVFELCLALPPGRHRYRLVIDGRWSADPYNSEREPNPFGDANSVVSVTEAPLPMEQIA